MHTAGSGRRPEADCAVSSTAGPHRSGPSAHLQQDAHLVGQFARRHGHIGPEDPRGESALASGSPVPDAVSDPARPAFVPQASVDLQDELLRLEQVVAAAVLAEDGLPRRSRQAVRPLDVADVADLRR